MHWYDWVLMSIGIYLLAGIIVSLWVLFNNKKDNSTAVDGPGFWGHMYIIIIWPFVLLVIGILKYGHINIIG